MSAKAVSRRELEVITDASEILDAFELLRQGLSEDATVIRRHLGWRGGGGEYDVIWREPDGFWAVLDDNPARNRYWCSYGAANPEKYKSLPIIVEINPTRVGRDRRHGGMFLRSADGSIFLAHDGRVAGGKKGVGKRAFLATLNLEAVASVASPSGAENAVVIGQVGSSNLPRQLRRYLDSVARFKSGQPTSGVIQVGKPYGDHPEFSGKRKPYTYNSPIESRVDHGVIADALAQELDTRGFVPMRDIYRDIYLAQDSGAITALFEIKPSTDTSSIYSAIGQLLYHSAATPMCLRVVVLADDLSGSTMKVLSALGIKVIVFEWVDGRPVFDGLDAVIGELDGA